MDGNDGIWLARPEPRAAGTAVAVKDLLDTAGLPTTYGSGIFASHLPAVRTVFKPISSVYLVDDPATWEEIRDRGHAAIVGVGH